MTKAKRQQLAAATLSKMQAMGFTVKVVNAFVTITPAVGLPLELMRAATDCGTELKQLLQEQESQ